MYITNVKLLHLFKSFTVGGVEKSTILYSNRVSCECGFIGIFARKGAYDHSNIISEKVKQFHPIGNMKLNPATALFYLISIFSIIRHHDINVINYHHRIFIPVIWCIKLLRPSIVIIYTAHNYFNDSLNILITADRILAVSEAIRTEMQRFHGKKTIRIVHGIEPHPVEICHFHNFRVGYVGRFESHKGIITLIDAMKILLDTNNNYSLIFRGEGPFEMEMMQYARELEIESHVSLEPPQVHAGNIYGGIDVLILPSLELEGFPMVLLEAMGAGIPLVGSDIPGINEIIINGQNGRLTPPGNSFELAMAIQFIFKNNEEREKYIAHGLRAVSEKYSIEEHVSEYCRILNGL